jgi:hypothetical protein
MYHMGTAFGEPSARIVMRCAIRGKERNSAISSRVIWVMRSTSGDWVVSKWMLALVDV